ncbi:PREDICTED: uncharacterized protein LOC104589726 [Nelumbo nucifera]|uniref:DUF1685 domain-containing protein n=2 Tax=Nelumbo nucifera TaxID=4432 RepID=A0A822YUM7_NELNU|nr:PREDICTED: uncharacterized protein LOC104589726 [Nelumbo nucifera]DAD37794.1 TPA_asm: hypothetical protein HUJ06_008435 [Nelumbo nucifera]
MDAEEVLSLFDSYWFDHQILTKKPPSSPPVIDPVPEIQKEAPELEISHPPTLHVRYSSDQLSSKASFKSETLSPNSVLPTPKLETILSGKDATEVAEEITRHEEAEKPTKKATGRRRKRGSSKSLSELEFEELKGFMDLGFIFSEADKDSSLVSIIPGLQRMGKKGSDEEQTIDESTIPRPYLSEAWAVLDRRKERNPLTNWRIPSARNEIDMKDHLRFWAHTVASTVR